MRLTITRRILFTATFAASFFLFFALPAYAAIESPLRPEVSSIPGFIEAALKALVMIALPILTLFIVYSGFKFIAAQGNSSKLEVAKHNFVYVILGALLILGAWVVATLVGGTVNQLTG